MGWLNVLFSLLVLVIVGVQHLDSKVIVRTTDITTTGKTFRVICTVEDEDYIGWYRVHGDGTETKIVGKDFFRDKLRTEDRRNRHTLIVKNVVVADGGYYRCKGSKTSELFHLYVEFYVLEFPENQRLNRGQTEVIRCSAEGYPKPHFRWYKDWNPTELDYTGDRFSLLNNGSLLVKNVEETDTGNYSCRITQLDESERTREEQKDIQVVVYGPPRIDLSKSSTVIYSYKGNLRKVPIVCRFWGFPVPQMKITKSNRQLKDKQVKARTITGHVRVKKNSDFGPYVCKATNELGSASHTVHLKEAGGPDYPTNVTVHAHCGYITVTWDPPSFDGGLPVLMYHVELVLKKKVVDYAAVKNQRRRFTFNGGLIKPNTIYMMRIRGENEARTGVWVTLNVTSDICPPSGKVTITNKDTVLNTTSFVLTWTDPPDNGGDPSMEYIVEYRRLDGARGDSYWTSRKGIQGRQLLITGLSRGERYTFRVIAVTKRGQNEPGEKDFQILADAVTPTPTTTPVPPPDREVVFDMSVNCSALVIQVDMSLKYFPNLDRDSFRLQNDTCGPYMKSRSHVVMRTRLDGCGTTATHRNLSVTYYNSVTARVVSSNSRIEIIEFPFSCTFDKKRSIGEPSFQPRKKVTVVEEGFGNFSFVMDLFHSDKYKAPYAVSDYPVQVNPTSERLYAQTRLLASDKDLVALAHQCVATPSTDPNDKTHYKFIDRGCAVDDTVKFHPVASRDLRFEMVPFKFRNSEKSVIYLHCRMIVCHKDDEKSRCSRGCVPGDRNRRDMDTSRDMSRRRSVSHGIILGPVGLTTHARSVKEHPTMHRGSGSLAFILAIVFGVVLGSVLLFAAIGFVLRQYLIRVVSGRGTGHVKVVIDNDDMELHEAVPI